MHIDYYVGLSNVQDHIVFQDNWLIKTSKHSMSDSKVLNEVFQLVWVKSDLEVPPELLLSCLWILRRDHKVINNFSLRSCLN